MGTSNYTPTNSRSGLGRLPEWGRLCHALQGEVGLAGEWGLWAVGTAPLSAARAAEVQG